MWQLSRNQKELGEVNMQFPEKSMFKAEKATLKKEVKGFEVAVFLFGRITRRWCSWNGVTKKIGAGWEEDIR